MKILRIALYITVVGSLLSCSSDKQSSAYDEKSGVETPNSSKDSINLNVNNNPTKDNEEYPLKSEVNGPELDRMYKDLDMSEEQIVKFEKHYSIKALEIKKSNESQLNKDDQLKKQMQESLKLVLTEDEYLKYQEWELQRSKN